MTDDRLYQEGRLTVSATTSAPGRAHQAGELLLTTGVGTPRALQLGLLALVANMSAARERQVGVLVLLANPRRARAYQVGLLVLRQQLEDYPEYVQGVDSQLSWEPVTWDRDALGGPHGRMLTERRRARLRIAHPHLTAAERTALDGFVAAHRGSPGRAFFLTFQPDGRRRRVVLTSSPVYREEHGNNFSATLTVAEE